MKKTAFIALLLVCFAAFALVSCELNFNGSGSESSGECSHPNVRTDVTVPTCEESGSEISTCTECGYTITNHVDPIGHQLAYREGKIPTCTEEGWDGYYFCERCDYTEYQLIQPFGHELAFHVERAPTCEDAGCNSYYTCNVCDYTTYEQIPAKGHTPGPVPTCTEAQRCTTCYEVIEYAYGHSVGAGATCTSDQICTVCNEIVMSANGHVSGFGPTCTSDRVCLVCFEVLEAAYGHTPGNEPSCEWDVWCGTCGVTIEVAPGHTWVSYEGKAPDCENSGWDEYRVCEVCEYSTYNELGALGHTNDYHYGQSATCTEDGWNSYYTCERCDYTTYEELKAYGHSETVHPAKDATCEEIGWDEYVTCSNCDYNTYNEIPANGHDYVNLKDSCTACGEIKTSEGLRFKLVGGDAYVSGIGSCTDSTVVIPFFDNDGRRVVGIYDGAFENCDSVTEITIYGNIANIGERAFANCTSLSAIEVSEDNADYTAKDGNLYTKEGDALIAYCIGKTAVNFEIPDGVCSILSYAFSGSRLESIKIPDSVEAIEASAFENCAVLLELELPDGLSTLATCAFAGCSSLAEITVPEAITKISEKLFYGCSALESVLFKGAVTDIGISAFENCASLSSIEFTDSLSQIGATAFYGCTSLSEITVPDTALAIGLGAFGGCKSLSKVTFPFVGTNPNGSSAFDAVFGGKNTVPSSLKEIVITGAGVIAKDAFRSCYSVENIEISDKVTKIGANAFSGCSALKSLTLPFIGSDKDQSEGIVSGLFGYVFGRNTYSGSVATVQKYKDESGFSTTYQIPASLKNVVINGGKLTFGAFSGCANIENISLYNISEVSGDLHFEGCTSLKYYENNDAYFVGNEVDKYLILISVKNNGISSIKLPESTLFISAEAFYEFKNLTKVELPAGLVGIGNSAFYNCTSLKNVTLPASLKMVGNYAFYGCKGFDRVEFPAAMRDIGQAAFYDCTNVVNVSFAGSLNTIGAFAFSGCTKLSGIDIPEGCVEIGEYAFQGCTALTNVKIPSTMERIGNSAFGNAKISNAVYIPSVEAWLNIEFSLGGGLNQSTDYTSNPLWCADKLIVNGVTLTELTVPSTVTEIGANAFGSYERLTKVIIPANVTAIGQRAFEDCTGLVSVELPERSISISSYAFAECTSLKEINIPGKALQVNSFAFYSCTALKKVVIGEGVTKINESAFDGCSKLYSLTLPSTLTNIGYKAFRNCSSLVTLTVPRRVSQIEAQAFENCYKLVEIFNLSSLSMTAGRGEHGGISLNAMCVHKDNAVQGDVFVENGFVFVTDTRFTNRPLYLVSYIGEDLKITLPSNRNYSVYKYAFYGSDITDLTVSSSVSVIGEYAFSRCASLYSVDLGSGVKNIGTNAFASCASLYSVKVGANVNRIASGAFSNCNKLASATFANVNGWEYQHAESYPITTAIAISASSLSSPYAAVSVLTGRAGYNIVRTK